MNKLLSRKVVENTKLIEENEDLKRQVEDSQLVISALSKNTVDKEKLNAAEKKCEEAQKENREMQKEKDRLKNLLNKSNSELKDAQHRLNKVYNELTKLKADVQEKYITKQEHQRALKVSQDYIKSLQVEIDLFRKEFNNMSSCEVNDKTF